MAGTVQRKTTAKRPASKASRSSKHGVRDRLTPEQRKRVDAYAKSLKGGNVNSLSSHEIDTSIALKTPVCPRRPLTKCESSFSAGRYSSHQYVPPKQKHTKTDITKLYSVNAVHFTREGLVGKDPPSSASMHLLGETRSLKVCKPVPFKRSEDPPISFLNANANANSAKDPPNYAKDSRLEKSPSQEQDKMEVETPTASFSESLKSRWNLLHRGLQAIGLVSAVAADIESSDSATGEVFYDAIQFEMEEQHFVVEDVTDEDEEIRDMRRVTLNAPSLGQSWMEPNDNLDTINPKRFSKPDP